jgi:hypothetical protein
VKRLACLTVAVAVTVLALSGCGGSSGAANELKRPHTDARLLILSPTPNEITGPNVVLRFQVLGATVSPAQLLHIVPNEGHIHVSLDGKLVVMAYAVSTTVAGLAAGVHTLQAEFVANDHLPFANRVIAVALFTVKA